MAKISEKMRELIDKYAVDRQYSLDLEKREMQDVVREFNMMLIQLNSTVPEDAPEHIAAQMMADRNYKINEFIKYLQARKY